MSIADFKKIYWFNEMKGKLDRIERNYKKPEKNAQVSSDLTLIINEIGKELKNNPKITFPEYGQLTKLELTPSLLKKTRNYLELTRSYYKKLYNAASDKKDKMINELQKKDKEGLIKMKQEYLNDQLKEFVTNKNTKNRIIEYKGQLIQKIDPIYLDPTSRFIKAQFYAPRKQLFGHFIHTFWINIMVIWVMTIISFLVLRYRLLKKFLDQMELLTGRLFPKDEM
jgi:hypothetical protein